MIKLVSLFLLMMTSYAWAQSLDRIVAVVDNEVVLESELLEMAKTISLQMKKREVALPPNDVFVSQVLERLIIKKLQMQNAARIGLRLSEEELNASIKEIAQNNNMTLKEFRNVIERDGYDFGSLRESIREDILTNRLKKKEVGDKIVVSDREVENFLATQAVQGDIQDAYQLLHILVSVPEAASPEQVQAAQAKLDKVRSLLAAGGNFSEIASGYSDAQNALEGGDLGWRRQGELPSLFSKVVPELAVGEISEPIRGGGGFHLVKVKDKKTQSEHMVKQTKLSHILIKTNDIVSDADAQKRLGTLKIRVENGDDFAELARAHSDDMVSAINGGDLGWTSPGVLVPEFEKEMNVLADSEMSPVFKSRFGWHLIKLDQRREQNMAEEYKRSKAREQIHSRRMAEEVEAWTRRLRDEAYVEFRNP